MLRFNKIIAWSVVVAAIGSLACLFLITRRGRSDSYAESHAIARTRMDIQNAELAIQLYVSETGAFPINASPKGDVAIDAASLYQTLYGDETLNLKYGIGQPPQHWKSLKKLVDRWDNDLHFEIKAMTAELGLSETNSYSLRVWSNGPNGVNEGGKSDDIERTTRISSPPKGGHGLKRHSGGGH